MGRAGQEEVAPETYRVQAVKAVLVFFSVAIADVIWARYIQSCAEKRQWAAAGLAALVVLVGSVFTLALMDDPRYVLPAAAGAFVGTFWATKR